MHTFKGREGTVIHHDGDPEGSELRINVPPDAFSHERMGDLQWVEVKVPANDIIDFVLDRYLSDYIIGFLEHTPLRILFNRLKRGLVE